MIKLDKEIAENLLNESLELLLKLNFHTIQDLNNLEFSRKNGIIYLIYVKTDNEIILKYIGKSLGAKFHSRLKSHFLGIGKGTQSKYQFVSKELELNNQIFFKFFETEPVQLRNFLEEILITHFKSNGLLWNYKNPPIPEYFIPETPVVHPKK